MEALPPSGPISPKLDFGNTQIHLKHQNVRRSGALGANYNGLLYNRMMQYEHSKSFNVLLYIFLFVGLVGLWASLYLTIAYYTGVPLSCEFINGCNAIIQSEYSYIIGVSMPSIGVVYYLFTILNVFLYLHHRSNFTVSILNFLTTLGFFVSLYFLYLQLYLVELICAYCMTLTISAIILFVLGKFIRAHHIKHRDEWL